ncbi:hypothetical protein [Halochromatium roseum]|uniref:hypothetical protein n=1 Tax=Halochromatium roseum TaxID=391920 RepID=UPI0019114861|nr:hypothetical protein [Halochromatium roseum]
MEPVAGERLHNFAAQTRAFSLGDLLIADSCSRGHFIWRGGECPGTAGTDLLLLQIQGEGQAINGVRTMALVPGAIRVIDLADPYLAEDRGFRCLTLAIPRARLGAAAAGRPGGLVLPLT